MSGISSARSSAPGQGGFFVKNKANGPVKLVNATGDDEPACAVFCGGDFGDQQVVGHVGNAEQFEHPFEGGEGKRGRLPHPFVVRFKRINGLDAELVLFVVGF